MMLVKSEKAARMGEKVLVLIDVLAALGLAVLIAVIDLPAMESGSGMCDQGNCQPRVYIERLWYLWPSW